MILSILTIVLLSGGLVSAEQAFAHTPTITSTAILTATEGTAYSYDVESGHEGNATYSLTTTPSGMTIDSSTGVISWTPTNDQVGSNSVVVQLAHDVDIATQSFDVTVDNVNPTITSTAILTATEGTAYSYTVTSDEDGEGTITYSLTTTPSGMTIDSSTGVISWTPTNDQVGSNSVVVSVDDGNTGTDTQSFTVTVVDTTAPALSPNISIAHNNTSFTNAKSGTEVTVTFDVESSTSVVTGTIAGETAVGIVSGTVGTLKLTLSGNEPQGLALLFSFVEADAAGNAGTPQNAVKGTGLLTSVIADFTAPAAPTINQPTTPTNNSTPTITGTAEIGSTVRLLDGGSQIASTTADAITGVWSTILSTQTDGTTLSLIATATDAAGNASIASTPPVTLIIDTTPPTVPSITQPTTLTNISSITITGSTEAGATVELFNNGTSLSTEIADSSGVFTFTGVALSEGLNSFTATASDGLNTSAASTAVVITLDTTAPTVSITSPTPNPTNGNIIFVVNTENEISNSQNENDPVITVTNASILSAPLVDATEIIYHFNVQANSDGPVTLTIPANYIKDAAGNGNIATSFSVTSDKTNPSVTITATTPTNATTSVVTVKFSESVFNFISDDITIPGNTTLASFTGSNGTDTYTFIFTPLQNAANVITVPVGVAFDAATNLNTVATFTLTHDSTAPTTSTNVNDITTSISINSDNTIVTVKFSEPVNGFELSDIMVINGTKSNFTPTSAFVSDYTFTITPTPNTTTTINIPADVAVDGAGNSNIASDVFTLTHDNVSPTVTITTPDNPTRSTSIPVTITFSEPVTGLNATTVTVSGGTMGSLQSTDSTSTASANYYDIFTFNITPTSNNILVNVAAGVATDLATNGNIAKSLNIQYISSSGGSDDNAHKTRPTFGLDHKTGIQLIEGGFSFNGVSHDITDNFWTPFAEQEVLVGDTNTFTIKTYADKQLKVQEFLFGIPAVGDAHKAELGIEIFYGYDGTVEDIKVIQKTDVIDAESLQVSHLPSKCAADDDVDRCITTSVSMKFLEPLKDKVMALKAIDFKNRYQITYLNDGFDVTGDSLNPMISTMIAGTEKYEKPITITQDSKYSNTWTSDDGRTFQSNDYDTFTWTNETHERTPDTGDIKTRLHSEFTTYKDSVTAKAVLELLELCPTCLESFADFDDSFAYEYPEVYELKADNPELQEKLISENIRAQEIMNHLLDPISFNLD